MSITPQDLENGGDRIVEEIMGVVKPRKEGILEKIYNAFVAKYYLITLTEPNRGGKFIEKRFVVRGARNVLKMEDWLLEEIIPEKEKKENKKFAIYDIKKL